jgi:type I restriction enzyme S subunit
VLSPRPQVEPRYLGWISQSDPFVEQVVARSVGVSYPAINPSEIGEVRVPVPPDEQQRAMADYLENQTTSIGTAQRSLRKQMLLLEERRQALITAVVTGELDIPTGPESQAAS